MQHTDNTLANIDDSPPRASLLRRVRTAFAREVEDLNFRYMVADILVRLLPSMSFASTRSALYRGAGVRVGKGSVILGRLEFTSTRGLQAHLQIGSRAVINKRVLFDVTGQVTVGHRVSIGHDVIFITAEHELGPSSARAGALRSQAIVLGDGCWIGARSTILPGVSVGEGSVVAAGSLVASDVPPNKLVGGVPARTIRALPE
jgi:serine acetyltransferase